MKSFKLFILDPSCVSDAVSEMCLTEVPVHTKYGCQSSQKLLKKKPLKASTKKVVATKQLATKQTPVCPNSITTVTGQQKSMLQDDNRSHVTDAMIYLSSTYFLNLNSGINTPKSYTHQLINNYPNILKMELTKELNQVNGLMC